MTSSSGPSCIITIDGPAGTGKSTVAKALADRLGFDCLDTGSMYRAVAVLALESGVAADDGPGLASLAEQADLRFDWAIEPPAICIGDRDVSVRVRDQDVSSLVSPIARQSAVRTVLDEAQRRIAAERPRLVTEGRDQGSVVFPDADVRFFLDADEQVRASRRARQMEARGDGVNEEKVRRDIRQRDEADRSRSTAPLVQPEGSIRIDSTTMTVKAVVDQMVEEVQRVMPGIRVDP